MHYVTWTSFENSVSLHQIGRMSGPAEFAVRFGKLSFFFQIVPTYCTTIPKTALTKVCFRLFSAKYALLFLNRICFSHNHQISETGLSDKSILIVYKFLQHLNFFLFFFYWIVQRAVNFISLISRYQTGNIFEGIFRLFVQRFSKKVLHVANTHPWYPATFLGGKRDALVAIRLTWHTKCVAC